MQAKAETGCPCECIWVLGAVERIRRSSRGDGIKRGGSEYEAQGGVQAVPVHRCTRLKEKERDRDRGDPSPLLFFVDRAVPYPQKSPPIHKRFQILIKSRVGDGRTLRSQNFCLPVGA